MTKIIICGCLGRLGTAIDRAAETYDDIQIIGGTDAFDAGTRPYPVYKTINDCNDKADVIINVMSPTAVEETLQLLTYCKETFTPLVTCTTGLDYEVQYEIDSTAKEVAILESANMSLGINLLVSMLNRASKLLYEAGFDIEIIEKHHSKKLDAPSGTAFMLANSINQAIGGGMEIVTDRSRSHTVRQPNEIGIHALRGGEIVGEHSVVFAGGAEVIELTHIAQNRDVFAVGALRAALFLAGKAPGLYTMQDVVEVHE